MTHALSVIDWVGNDWEHARWVDQGSEATAVAGHSESALLAALVANARSSITAFVGLSQIATRAGCSVNLCLSTGSRDRGTSGRDSVRP